MRAAWAICRRDLLAAFTTPLAWLVIAVWSLVLNGVFVLFGLYQHQAQPAGEPLFVTSLGTGVWLLTLLAPAITMNSFASERVQGTMQLLLTVPVREVDLVVGKFLAALLVMLALIAASLVQPLTLLFVSDLHGPHLLVGYVGLALACAFLAALGVWISLLVESPVTAYVLTFGAILVLHLVGFGPEGSALHPIGEAIGIDARTRRFFAGELRLGDAAYLAAGAGMFLVMAHTALRARRLHG